MTEKLDSRLKDRLDDHLPLQLPIFRKSNHGYDILLERDGRLSKVATLSERTGEFALLRGHNDASLFQAALDHKRSLIQQNIAQKPEASVHQLLAMMMYAEQLATASSDDLTLQNLIDIQYGAKSLLSKVRKRLQKHC